MFILNRAVHFVYDQDQLLLGKAAPFTKAPEERGQTDCFSGMLGKGMELFKDLRDDISDIIQYHI